LTYFSFVDEVEALLIALCSFVGARKLRKMEPNVPKEISKIMEDHRIPMAAVLSTTRNMIVNLQRKFGIQQNRSSLEG
jgi:hypothetical protein